MKIFGLRYDVAWKIESEQIALISLEKQGVLGDIKLETISSGWYGIIYILVKLATLST